MNFCNKVITIPQFGSTCWFNAILMSVLYSQESRKLLLYLSKSWDKSNKILKIFKELLYKKYIQNKDDVVYFNIIRPEYILHNLNKYNKKKFPLNIFTRGYLSEIYIRKIYKLFGASVLMFDTFNNEITYSRYNNGIAHLEENAIKFNTKIISKNKIDDYLKSKPSVIIINHNQNKKSQLPYYYNIYNKELISYKDNINFNGNNYKLDSIILSNWNKYDIKKGHAIAGIHCKNERYVYNGWTRSTIDPSFLKNNIEKIKGIPCELMKFNWDLQNNPDFCLNTEKCIPKIISENELSNLKLKDICFNFKKPKRTLIYIKQDKNYESIDFNIEKQLKECPEGKILNPITGRCIKKINLEKKIKDLTKVKECPEGKILNPKTGRCIKKINLEKKIKDLTKVKECPEGKILNPKTGRCIKNKIEKPKKECPEGKILNPKTGRCIKNKI